MKRFIKSCVLLMGIAWTTILLVQLLEFPYHLEFWSYHTLVLPLFLIASASGHPDKVIVVGKERENSEGER